MKKIIFLSIIFLAIFIYPSFSYALNLDSYTSIGIMPIACERYENGVFTNDISIVFVSLKRKVIDEIIFGFEGVEKGSKIDVSTETFYIDEVKKLSESKMLIKGQTSWSTDFTATISEVGGKIIFNLIITGPVKGNIEIKNISPVGLKLKDKYLKQVDFGE